MYADWVVADCAGYSTEKKKTLKNLFFTLFLLKL